jgi:hypothetical protein
VKDANNSAVRDYKEKLLAESKTVRTELHRRLPERLHRPNLSKIYDNPSIVLEMETIADDLELLLSHYQILKIAVIKREHAQPVGSRYCTKLLPRR